MIQHAGLYWPEDVGTSWHHALEHVKGLEWAIARCRRHRTALQAGGNMGLWPKRLAEVFARVLTFEPDVASRACLVKNLGEPTPGKVEVFSEALGQAAGHCTIKHRGLGSHQVTDGSDVQMITIDSLGLEDLDLLQLDVEGYEWHALAGAVETLKRCHPLVQVELRNFTTKHGRSDLEVRQLLEGLGYQEVRKQPGSDYVFEVAA